MHLYWKPLSLSIVLVALHCTLGIYIFLSLQDTRYKLSTNKIIAVQVARCSSFMFLYFFTSETITNKKEILSDVGILLKLCIQRQNSS